ncbi:putative cyclin-D2-3 [Lolium rigidum]|uniref:putative cyclin-D2-3 n=1 Tax=Lolium rigidum TaxID=89674 RepID=UPI001F5D3C3A|nr:putative cyclin-D2-3 [Lolium rigidum]
MVLGTSSSISLFCEEDSGSILRRDDYEAPETGRDLDLSGFARLQLESDELVGLLMAKEREQFTETAARVYLERLNNGGLELSWRTNAIDWICKVQSHYSFGPLCVYLAVNYLDRFLSSKQLPNDAPWAQQILAVACVSLAAKMEEIVVPQSVDFQVCGAKYVFGANAIQRMEVFVLSTLKWRMHSVTPFSYIDHFLDKFNAGKPLTHGLVSQCTKLILDTLKATKFLHFRPSEIAAAVALLVAPEAQLPGFDSTFAGFKIPVDKGNVARCCETMQEMALAKKNVHRSASPSGVLDASLCTSTSDDSITPGSSQTINSDNVNDNQACSPASKRARLS